MSNIILTKNALNKIHEVNLSQKIIYDTVNSPNKTFPGKQPGATIFQKQMDFGLVTVIGKMNEKGEIIVFTCWWKSTKNSYISSTDARFKDKSFLEKIFLHLLKILGL